MIGQKQGIADSLPDGFFCESRLNIVCCHLNTTHYYSISQGR